MEHHYLITETIPEIEAMGEQRLPIGTDFEGNIYFRQEGKECYLVLTNQNLHLGR